MTTINQHDIVKAMRVLAKIDVADEIKRRVDFISHCLKASQCKHLVLGISGGVDSSTCGRLAQLAVNQLNARGQQKYRFFALRLPYGVQTDEEDAQMALAFIQPDCILNLNMQASVDALHRISIEALQGLDLLTQSDQAVDFARGNVKARMRMIAQYEVAGLLKGLVLGTDHSAENVTGFYTKHGDGACDIAPLFGLNKRQVRALASQLGVPAKIIRKAPTADLESLQPSQPDEVALGLSYDQIDDFLEGKTIDPSAAARLIDIFIRTQHKRKPVVTLYDQKPINTG